MTVLSIVYQTSNSTTCQVKTTNIYHSTVSMGQESGSHLAEVLCFMVSNKVGIKLLARATVISRFNWGMIHSQVIVAIVRAQVLAGCSLEISVPCHESLSIRQLMTW